MKNLQLIVDYIKKPGFILTIVLIIFFLRGVFLATLNPIFTGQDEARHYNTIQHLNEPENKNWPIIKRMHVVDKKTFNDYNFSQEIVETGKAVDFDVFRHQLYNTVNFSDSYDGTSEATINKKLWKPYNFYTSPDTAGASLYHKLAAKIESVLNGSNILVRFFANRVFSVLLGTIAVLLAYLIARNIGFKEKESLILAAIVSFQPRYSIYFANINYDVLLMPLFALFTLGAVLCLKNGLNWKNSSVMIISAYWAYLAKGTGIALFGVLGLLMLYVIYEKIKAKIPRYMPLFYVFSAMAVFGMAFYFKKFLPLGKGTAEIFSSLAKYLNESLTMGRIGLASRTYWGTLTWTDNWALSNAIDIIWIIEALAITGLIIYLFSKDKPGYLPEKKYSIFLIVMIIALQIGIRSYDWKIFHSSHAFDLGTPGRYFLPNLAAHIILVFTGLGMLLHKLKKEKYFQTVLLSGLILMFAFSAHIIFNVILPRYYL